MARRRRRNNTLKNQIEEVFDTDYPCADYQEEAVVDVEAEEERGILGKTKDVLTSDTAIGVYKGVGIFAAGVVTGIGAMMFANRKKVDSDSDVCCCETYDIS